MKLKVAIDTGSLISLQLSSLLLRSTKYFSFIIGSNIKRELEQFTRKRDVLCSASKRILKLVDDKKITFVKISRKQKGEDEAVLLMKKYKCHYLISDDIEFVNKKSRKIKNIHFSIFVISFLYYAKEVSKRETRQCIDKIFKLRNWSDNLITLYAKEILKHI